MGPRVGLDGRKISSPPGFDPGKYYRAHVVNFLRNLFVRWIIHIGLKVRLLSRE